MKRFELRGNVQDVGLRIELISIGMHYNLKVYPTNVGEDRVVVLVSGEEQNIQRFYDYVKSTDTRINKEGSMYETTPLQDDNGPEPDWIFENQKFIMEQLRKGALEFFEIKQLLKRFLETMKKSGAKKKRKRE